MKLRKAAVVAAFSCFVAVSSVHANEKDSGDNVFISFNNLWCEIFPFLCPDDPTEDTGTTDPDKNAAPPGPPTPPPGIVKTKS